LTQTGVYPTGETVSMRLECSRPSRFALRLRVPAWSVTSMKINGDSAAPPMEKGFATLNRNWKNGDGIEIRLASRFRLEPINLRHPTTVALVKGPLVQFAIGDTPISVPREKLLSGNHGLTLRPFTAIEDERYSVYVEAT